MRTHTIVLSERELRAILHALDIQREQGTAWWRKTAYVTRLYERLLHLGER